MTPQKLDRRALTLWRWRLVAVTLLPSFLTSLFFAAGSLPWVVATAVWAGGFLAFFFWYYPLKYRKLFYYLNSHSLVIGCGVIYTREKSIAFRNIQYVTLRQTPLQRLMKLKTVTITAAGGWVYLPGVDEDTAARLQAWLTDAGNEEVLS